MYTKLVQIDALAINDHYYLSDQDRCYYLGEYTADKGYGYSATNQLISNLKKTPDKKNTAQWGHKLKAISTIAGCFSSILGATTGYTFIPIPPSKIPTDPLYDDRLIQILNKLSPSADVRPLLSQVASTESFHTSAQRLKPEQLAELYVVNPPLLNPKPKSIIIFDDLLTSGCHFRAAVSVLRRYYSDVPIIGLFIARRKLEPVTDFEIV